MGSQQKTKHVISTSATIVTKQVADSSKLIVLGFLESFLGLAYMCGKQTTRAKRKLWEACSKRLIRYKALKNSQEDRDAPLWKRTILMGDRCQPLDFSGVSIHRGVGHGSSRKVTEQIPGEENPPAGDRDGRLYLRSSDH